MVKRTQTGLAAMIPALSPSTDTCNSPPWPLGHRIWLPVATPESRGPVVLLGVYSLLNQHGFDSLVSGQIPEVLLDISHI